MRGKSEDKREWMNSQQIKTWIAEHNGGGTVTNKQMQKEGDGAIMEKTIITKC